LDTARKTLYRSPAAAENIVPTTTGAASAVGLVLPELEGKLDGMAVRVPLPNISMIDLTFEASRATSMDEINVAMQEAASGPLKGVLDVTTRDLVSSDFRHDPHSAVFATDQTRVMDGTFCRVLAWYDNEWGFSNRMLDTAAAMGQLSA
jgi:glyceraldehyde 3-phosphate dehydrogenase